MAINTPQAFLFNNRMAAGADDPRSTSQRSRDQGTGGGNPFGYNKGGHMPSSFLYNRDGRTSASDQSPALDRYRAPRTSDLQGNTGVAGDRGGYSFNLPDSRGPHPGAWGNPAFNNQSGNFNPFLMNMFAMMFGGGMPGMGMGEPGAPGMSGGMGGRGGMGGGSPQDQLALIMQMMNGMGGRPPNADDVSFGQHINMPAPGQSTLQPDRRAGGIGPVIGGPPKPADIGSSGPLVKPGMDGGGAKGMGFGGGGGYGGYASTKPAYTGPAAPSGPAGPRYNDHLGSDGRPTSTYDPQGSIDSFLAWLGGGAGGGSPRYRGFGG